MAADPAAPPADEARRWPSPRRAARRATRRTPCANRSGRAARRSKSAACRPDPRELRPVAARLVVPATRPSELELALSTVRHLIALLVDRAVMAPAEQDQIRQRGRTTASPMLHVVALGDAHAAAREATGRIAMVQRAP